MKKFEVYNHRGICKIDKKPYVYLIDDEKIGEEKKQKDMCAKHYLWERDHNW